MTATRVTVTGTWVTETDTPASGRISFLANDVGFVNGGETVKSSTVGVVLDKNGSISISLIRCPDGYTVTEEINGAYRRGYILPDQAGPVDLGSLVVLPIGATGGGGGGDPLTYARSFQIGDPTDWGPPNLTHNPLVLFYSKETENTGFISGLHSAIELHPTANSVRGACGLEGTAELYENFNLSDDSLMGVLGRATKNGSGVLDKAVGLYGSSGNFAGTVTEAIGVEVNVQTYDPSAVDVRAVGLKVSMAANVGTMTDAYGVWIDGMTAGTHTNPAYAIYSPGSAQSRFGGPVTLAQTVAGDTPLTLVGIDEYPTAPLLVLKAPSGAVGIVATLIGRKYPTVSMYAINDGGYAGGSVDMHYRNDAGASTNLFSYGYELPNTADLTTRNFYIYDHILNQNAMKVTAGKTTIYQTLDIPDRFLPPRLSTTQRDALSSPLAGLLIFNTTTGQGEQWNGTAWVATAGGGGGGAASPLTLTSGGIAEIPLTLVAAAAATADIFRVRDAANVSMVKVTAGGQLRVLADSAGSYDVSRGARIESTQDPNHPGMAAFGPSAVATAFVLGDGNGKGGRTRGGFVIDSTHETGSTPKLVVHGNAAGGDFVQLKDQAGTNLTTFNAAGELVFSAFTGAPWISGMEYSTYGMIVVHGGFWVRQNAFLVGGDGPGGQALFGNTGITLDGGNLQITEFGSGASAKFNFAQGALIPQLRLGGYAVDFGTSVVNVSTLSAAGIGSIIQGSASQTADLSQWQNNSTAILSRFNKDGFFMTRKVAAPADADLVASELAVWLDDTNGAAKVMFKAKQANGTVKTAALALT